MLLSLICSADEGRVGDGEGGDGGDGWVGVACPIWIVCIHVYVDDGCLCLVLCDPSC